METFEFSKSLVAFLDILGFKELVKNNPTLQNQTLDLLYRIKKINTPFEIKIASENGSVIRIEMQLNISSSSDHIIISCPLDIEDSFPPGTTKKQILFSCAGRLSEYINFFHIEALKIGLSFRGAIGVGDLHCDIRQNIIVGTPLIEAIEDESRLANYPRVIASQSLLDYIYEVNEIPRDNFYQKGLITTLTRDFDGMYFVDYLGALFTFYSLHDNFSIVINDVKQKIKKNIENFKGNLAVLSKWLWFAHYFDDNLNRWKTKTDKLNDIEAFELNVRKDWFN